MASMPYASGSGIVSAILNQRQDFINWYNDPTAPTDPADDTHPKHDLLATMTLKAYFQSRGMTGTVLDAVTDFFDRYAVDALAGRSHQVNALTSISFLGAELFPIMSFRGGNSAIARAAVQKLIPGAITPFGSGLLTDQLIDGTLNTSTLDSPTNQVRIRQNAIVVRADNNSSGAELICFHNGGFHRVKGAAVILGSQGHTAHRVTEHLFLGTTQYTPWLDDWREFKFVPVITANVVLEKAAPLVNEGLGYNNYYWGSQNNIWADFVVADWVATNSPAYRADPNRKTVLTFYGGNVFDPADMPHERELLLTSPFSKYEDALRNDLNRIFAAQNFDFDDPNQVSAVYLYRWGHGMI
jgi:hypothetical protein